MIQVSICIPVYNAEQYLEQCIESAISAAHGLSYEIIVVNDGSQGNCDEIVYGRNVGYIKHASNQGLLEARRTTLKYARGEYVFMLDCDDMLLPDSLSKLYRLAKDNDCSFVQGAGIGISDTDVSVRRKHVNNNFIHSKDATLTGDEILESYMVKKYPSSYLCNKLIKRSIYMMAFAYIPEIYVVLNEDYLQMFFIAKLSSKFISIPDEVVMRRLDTGVTCIEKDKMSLEHFKQLCSIGKIHDVLLQHAGKYTDIILRKRAASERAMQDMCNKLLEDKDAGNALIELNFDK